MVLYEEWDTNSTACTLVGPRSAVAITLRVRMMSSKRKMDITMMEVKRKKPVHG